MKEHNELPFWFCFINNSYFLGSLLIKNGIAVWQAFLIGTLVVSLGALTEVCNAPIWLIVLIPFPVGMLLLYLFLNQPLHTWFFIYITVLALYSVIHVIMSCFFQFQLGNYHSFRTIIY